MARIGSERISNMCRHFTEPHDGYNRGRQATNSLCPSRPQLSSLYRETRRSLAASCELCDSARISFTGLDFYRIFCRGNSWDDCYFGWIRIYETNGKRRHQLGTYFDIWVSRYFHTRPDRPWGPPNLLYNGNRASPEVKRLGRSINHSPHLAPKLKKV
jgi:hypothetical protein